MINSSDIEFFTFFCGIQKSELDRLSELVETFPYYNTHKLTVIDKSRAIQSLILTNPKKFYGDHRSYVINYPKNLSIKLYDEFFKTNKNKVVRLEQEKYTFYDETLDDVLNHISNKKFVIIMDSDISFNNDQYLKDILHYINNDDLSKLAAVGTIVQRQLFKLSINKVIPSNLLDLITVERLFTKKQVLRNLITGIIQLFYNIIYYKKVKRLPSLSRYPRLRNALLAINRDYFTTHKLRSGYMYLDVDNIDQKGEITKHRVFGDACAALLSGIALSGGKVININIYDYITHFFKGSYGELTSKEGRWNWFNSGLTDDPIKDDSND